MRVRSYVLAATLAAATPALATDFQALRTDPEISAGLRWIAAADILRNSCPSVEERTWQSRRTALRLLNRAFSLGYSMGEATEYVDSPTEQARVRSEATAYLRQVGVVEGDAASYCNVAQAEISKNSAIGVLLQES